MLRLPAVRVTAPDAVRVVPAAIVVVARKSSAPSVCEPVTVPPAKTTSEDPWSTVPAAYVQPFDVRIVPASVSVPDGLLMLTSGTFPAAVVAAPVSVCAPVPLISSVPVPPP